MTNEKRLIDANSLLATMKEMYCDGCKNYEGVRCRACDFDSCMGDIDDAPTVDAVEVVHGRWIQSEPGYRLCSHCMADVAIYSGHRNYCPNCGAKMDGKGEGE